MFGSDCSSSSCSLDDDDDDNDTRCTKVGLVGSTSQHGAVQNLLSNKCIIHLDIDCFYCQCEEILDPTLADKPLAIGQKHIIVTANYVARKLGIKKLMGRRDAIKLCPTLTIIEGSDLEKYRKASQQVYSEFRNVVKKDFGKENAVKKGSMDEMFADITFVVEKDFKSRMIYVEARLPPKTFIYGEDVNSSVVRISEDQSGAEATITNTASGRYSESDDTWGNVHERKKCMDKLQIAAIIANQIREKVRSKTQFSTTVGVSVSPMLAKLASDLKKPDSCNILYPWRAKTIILNMPLRRVPGLGSRTLSSLSSCLLNHNEKRTEEAFWTCRDLLNVPRHAIISSLSERESFKQKW
mmetsp:Transcript_4571/g.6701  ORF Transcript_4571/g.6701 Transcript_4571/m.6701 type:complete len:354 (+) Transcript_4571:76-1137(+)